MIHETIRWKRGNIELIDQRLLPGKLKYSVCRTSRDIYDAIKELKVRGAPAIGVAGAFGVYLGVRNSRASTGGAFIKEVRRAAGYLAGARPTARNLFWGIERMEQAARLRTGLPVPAIKKALFAEAAAILNEDKATCGRIGRHGSGLIRKGSTLLTYCNAGALATAGSGTALSVIYAAKGRIKMVYSGETRPVLQGARLTVWELTAEKVPVTLICDNMAASLMSTGKVDAVIVGADRIAANGDTANKVGTYGLALIAKAHGVPFYVAAPFSTFDLSMKDGSRIDIEQRPPDEVRKIQGRDITVKNAKVWNPAFDVTPAGLITAIVTEKGIILEPNTKKIKALSDK